MTDTATLITQLRSRTAHPGPRPRSPAARRPGECRRRPRRAAAERGRRGRAGRAHRRRPARPRGCPTSSPRCSAGLRCWSAGRWSRRSRWTRRCWAIWSWSTSCATGHRYVAAWPRLRRHLRCRPWRRGSGYPRRDGAVADLVSRTCRRAEGPQGSPLQHGALVTLKANAPEPFRPSTRWAGWSPHRRDGDRSGQGSRQGRQGPPRSTRRAYRLGVEAADAVVATGRGAAGRCRMRRGTRRRRDGRRGHRPDVCGARPQASSPGTFRDQAPGRIRRTRDAPEDPEAPGRHWPPAGYRSSSRRDPGVRRPFGARRRGRPGTLDDPRAVAAMLEFEQAHGNRPGVVAAARLRATARRHR